MLRFTLIAEGGTVPRTFVLPKITTTLLEAPCLGEELESEVCPSSLRPKQGPKAASQILGALKAIAQNHGVGGKVVHLPFPSECPVAAGGQEP